MFQFLSSSPVDRSWVVPLRNEQSIIFTAFSCLKCLSTFNRFMEVSFQCCCHFYHLSEFLKTGISLSKTEVSCCSCSISFPQSIACEYSFIPAVLSFAAVPANKLIHYEGTSKIFWTGAAIYTTVVQFYFLFIIALHSLVLTQRNSPTFNTKLTPVHLVLSLSSPPPYLLYAICSVHSPLFIYPFY